MYIPFLIGRVIVGLYFIYSAYGHLMRLGPTTEYARSKGVPMPKLAVVVSGLMLLVGGLSVLFNSYPFIGMLLIVLFLIPTTFIMHAFWKAQDPIQKMNERISFFKNLALIGLLLMLIF